MMLIKLLLIIVLIHCELIRICPPDLNLTLVRARAFQSDPSFGHRLLTFETDPRFVEDGQIVGLLVAGPHRFQMSWRQPID